MGYLHSRRGAGFYARSPQPQGEGWPENSNDTENAELVRIIRRSLESNENTVFPGGGWLPNDWLDDGGMRKSLNILARRNGGHLHHYGRLGYLPLREHLSVLLGDVGITAGASQILLTTGRARHSIFLSASC